MKKLLIGGMLPALLLPCHVMAQSVFDGTWKVDLDKVNEISNMTVSADGKALTTVITYKPSNRMVTLVANKQ